MQLVHFLRATFCWKCSLYHIIDRRCCMALSSEIKPSILEESLLRHKDIKGKMNQQDALRGKPLEMQEVSRKMKQDGPRGGETSYPLGTLLKLGK